MSVQVKCKACGERVPLVNVDLRSMTALCGLCGVTFSAETQLDKKTVLEDGKLLFPLANSDAIDVVRFDQDLYITRRWKRPSAASIMIMSAAGLLIPLLALFAVIGAPELAGAGSALLCLVPIWLILAHRLVASLMNSTELIVVDGEIVLKQGPVPGWPNGKIRVERIAQLFVAKPENDNAVASTYNLNVQAPNGRTRTLLSGISDLEQARCLEQLLERHLGLRDRRVRGEVRNTKN